MATRVECKCVQRTKAKVEWSGVEKEMGLLQAARIWVVGVGQEKKRPGRYCDYPLEAGFDLLELGFGLVCKKIETRVNGEDAVVFCLL